MPHRGAMRNLRRQLAPILRQSLARWFERNFGQNFNPRDFSQNLRSVPSEVVGCFPCILLHRFLQKRPSIEISASSFLRSLKTISAENLLESGSYAMSLLWCCAFLCWQLRPRFFVGLFASAMTLRSHENTGWLPMLFLFLSDKISLIPKTVYTALRRPEHGRATDAFLTT